MTTVLVVVFMCFATPPASASSALSISPEQQLDLADAFFSRAEYDAAVAEYSRFSHFFPEHPRAVYAGFKTALSYFLKQDYEKALPLFGALAGRGVDDHYGVEARFMISRCSLAMGRPGPAAAVLQNLIASVDNVDVRDRAYYHLGWISLLSQPMIDAAVVNRADEYFARISDKNRVVYNLGAMTNMLQGVEIDGKGRLLPRKKPQLAGALAVIPGAGYVYCGRYQDALASFLLNTVMACAVYEAFDAHMEALGGLIGTVGFGFYAGSIYGSISAAHKFNRAHSVRFLNRLQDIRVETGPLADQDGISLRLHLPF
jgi:hypothetical protein